MYFMYSSPVCMRVIITVYFFKFKVHIKLVNRLLLLSNSCVIFCFRFVQWRWFAISLFQRWLISDYRVEKSHDVTKWPVRDVIDQMLFKHEAPAANGVEKRLFERASVDAKPVLKQNDTVKRVHLAEQLLVRVNLHTCAIFTSTPATAADTNRCLLLRYFTPLNHMRLRTSKTEHRSGKAWRHPQN